MQFSIYLVPSLPTFGSCPVRVFVTEIHMKCVWSVCHFVSSIPLMNKSIKFQVCLFAEWSFWNKCPIFKMFLLNAILFFEQFVVPSKYSNFSVVVSKYELHMHTVKEVFHRCMICSFVILLLVVDKSFVFCFS